jgi:hypothetical protein
MGAEKPRTTEEVQRVESCALRVFSEMSVFERKAFEET